jgi:hypothetical protein
MAAGRPYGEFYDFYSVSPEYLYFGYHLVQGNPFKFQTPKHWNPMCRSMTAPAACVIITQQYSSATLLRFHSLKELLDAQFKIVVISIFFFFFKFPKS